MNKKRDIIICLYIIILINVIFIYSSNFFTNKIKVFSPFLNKDEILEKYEMMKLRYKDKKYIIVKNNEDEPYTLAEIVVQNDIDFIPKISVIIPVFNNELYLREALETVINQTLKEIEIICIDDGSIDNSLDILIKFSQKDKRITVLKQENLHSGVARNAGLSVAKGEYLSFLDSDDLFELTMLEEMYSKILEQNGDIIICQCKSINLDNGLIDEKKLNYSLRLDLIPNKESFSLSDIPNNIFQISQGWAWDKLFKTDFILSNNLKFQNIINTNDVQFTYTALCLAKIITVIQKRFIIKRHQHKQSLSANRKDDPACFILAFEKIQNNLKKKGLYKYVKGSFWNWAISLCIIQLKTLDKTSKEYLYNILHKKFNSWEYIDQSPPNSNRYRALHYIKNHKDFPTINIAFATDHNYFNLFLVSLISILKNSEYENLNIILLYTNITQSDIRKVNQLKDIRSFTFQTLYIDKYQFNDYPKTSWVTKESWYRCILADKFLYIDKILYLDTDTMIRKSLLPLWEINMDNKLIAAVEDVSISKEKAKNAKLKDNFYFNAGVLLINTKEWRRINLFQKIDNYVKNNNIYDADQSTLNILTDKQKIRLNPEFNFMEVWWKEVNCQYDNDYIELYKKKDPTIVHFTGIKPNNENCNNSFVNEFWKYNNISNTLNNIDLTIPIVLSTDEKYAPYMYTTMISILENANIKTFYIFYLLVPSNFSKSIESTFLKINDNYKCSINFIYLENVFNNYIQKIPHITLTTYYRLLIGNLLPKEIEKCIYLDIDVCVCKDLSELFNIDVTDYYIAGVVAAGYYFLEEKNCERLNLPSMKQYVNAGMLVVNLKKIREDNMTPRFIELANKNYDSQDQDVLNVACYGKIKTLPPKYNAMIMRLKENNPLLRNLFTEEEIYEAKTNPYIIHYAGQKKPWNNIGVHMENFWWNMAKKTPYINNLFNREDIYKNELKKWWFSKKKKTLNLDNPKTFNEKIQWLKLYDSTPIKSYLTDKYLVRKWVKDKIGEEYLIPLLGVYDKFDDINFENLPNEFVIKCNHGSGFNIIVKDKIHLNLTEVKSKVDGWMEVNYAFRVGLELQYRDIQPKIIIEKYMDDGTGDLRDYKIHCFNGSPKFIWLDSDRHTEHKRNLYDLKWNQLSYKVNPGYLTFPSPKKPKLLERLIELSSILSEGFAYARIDLYIIYDQIFFGEITFTSSSGVEEIEPKSFEKKLTSYLKLPKIVYDFDKGEYYRLFKPISLYPYYIVSIFLTLKFIYILKKIMDIINIKNLKL